MKYLGIDYGKKKVGLALSEGLSASPLKVIEISSLADALQQVLHIIKDESVTKVVVGMAESGESKSMTEKFIVELKKEVDVYIAAETLSSYNADKQMSDMGIKKSKKGQNDAIAASLILQEYLDSL